MATRLYTGYTESFIITGEDIARAYYLFLNPEKRGIIAGMAIRGQDIVKIVPDANSTLGWNDGYKPHPEETWEVNKALSKARDEMAEYKYYAERLSIQGKPYIPLASPESRDYLPSGSQLLLN